MGRTEIEARLVELGGEVVFPATPNLVDAVLDQLVVHPQRRRPRRLLPIAAVAAAALVIFVLAVPGTRRAVAELLGLGGVRVSVVAELPPGQTIPEAFGRAVSLAEAESVADFPLLLAEGYGDPVAIHLEPSVPGGLVTLAYEAGPGTYGLLITQMVGTVDRQALEKAIGPGTTLTAVMVGDDPGFWISGSPHLLFLLDREGGVREDRARLVGNTLLFVRDGVTVRIESALELADALEVARSLRS